MPKIKQKEKKIMEMFGSARDLRGEDYFNKMVNEAISRTNEIKETIGIKTAIQQRKLNSVMERIVDFEDMTEYEAKMMGLMYNNLAPDDTSHKISAKMVKSFLENVVKIQDADAYEKIMDYYDFKKDRPEKYTKKLGAFVENVWNKYRTVEYCYLYSKGFHDFVERYASRVDAENLSNIEKIKWLRLWIFIIKDQGFFWTDIKQNGKIYVNEQLEFDREVYLFPDCMLYLEKYINEYIPEKALNVEMLKRLITLYPEDIQKQVYCWAEIDGNSYNTNILRAGEVRMGLKRTLFPITWMTPLNIFCLNNYIKDNNPLYLEAAVKAYKNGGVESLDRIEKKGTDPFDNFKVKSFKSYELYSSEEKGVKKVLVVNSQRELEMFVEVYKWLLEHPDLRFGEENKTVAEYGIEDLLEEPEDEVADEWFFEMNFVASDEDINWDCFEKVIEGNEEIMSKYIKAEATADEVFDKIGFSSVNQARLVCNKKTSLLESEAVKMSAALKRIKMFGVAQAMKSDIIYFKCFKYMMSERKADLPKTMVNLYGKILK